MTGAPPRRIARFTAGSQHFVHDAVLSDGSPAVIRLTRAADLGLARGALHWSGRLRPRGIPLPKVLHSDLALKRHPCGVMVLERLAGRDLGAAYDTLTRTQRRQIARRLVDLQGRLRDLPEAAGYGFAPSETGPFPHATWIDVLRGDLARSRRWIAAAGVVDPSFVGRAETRLAQFSQDLARIPPTPFLHDTTTRNVLIDQGRLSGIVDVDDICYGDPLFLVGLIRMALAAHAVDPAYGDDWLALMDPDGRRRRIADLYTLIHCTGFLGELGQRFNNAAPPPVDPIYKARLEEIFETLHARIGGADVP